MAKQLFDSARAREAGKRSGKARRKQRLTLTQVEAELGALKTPADAERWLQRLTVLAVSGRVVGTVLHGAVRAVEIWMRVKEADASFEAVEALRDDVRKLREERDRLARELELAKLGVR